MNSRHSTMHTRREVLKKTGLAILATGSASLLPLTVGAQNAARKKRVIVAGGGIGGLCCAYELMERGHEVTVLEASRRTGGHVKTIRDPLPDGLYADVGAEHFTKPGYTEYWKYVEKFQLPAMPWPRRRNIVHFIDGEWFTEEQLADSAVLKRFGFNQPEIAYIVAHGWSELPRLYLDPYLTKFKDEYQPFGVGLDHLDEMLLGDLLAKDGLSEAAQRFIGARKRSSASHPPESNDVSALYRLWHSAIIKMRGLPEFPRDVFHLKGGNQLLPDTFATKLGERIRRNCPISAIEHSDSSVIVHFEQTGKPEQLSADYVVICISPLLMGGIRIMPAWSAAKAYALNHTRMDMQSRVLLQARTPFWKGDIPSINLVPGNNRFEFVCETAEDVPGDSCVLMSSGQPAQSPEESLAAFRKFYPGKAKDTIERCIVHEWWKEEPTCFGCERLAFPFGQLSKIWPILIEPVNRIHFAGAAYDNLNWGMDAATRSANRVAQAIHMA
ncbi:MAG: NAD(P)/FAD-dependent oxidoreductase [Acidobacteriota bacterium]